MPKGFVGFRLGKNDKDIEKDLERFTDHSKRLREAYRLAVAVERGEYVRASELGAMRVIVQEDAKPQKLEPLTWNIPTETPRKPKGDTQKPTGDGKGSIKNNMLQGF